MIPEIEAKTLVSTVAKKSLHWFAIDYNTNLYRGCCHGCVYCDSRSDCYGIEKFSSVRVKKNTTAKLSKELLSKRKKGVVAMGAMSDPYNPFEATLKVTRQALRIIDQTGFGLSVTTKSPLITRDIDILTSIQKKRSCIVKMTITCADDALSQKIEPFVAPSSKRFEALKKVSDAGIFCGVLVMPILPYINDTEENIRELVRLAANANAKFIYAFFGVTLRDNQREYYYQQIDALFPGLSTIYKEHFRNQYACRSPKYKKLYTIFVTECKRYGIIYQMDSIIKAYKKETEKLAEQLSLF